VHVTICIITCGRTDGLSRLLASIAGLEFPDAAPALEILVVDNHPDETAREVCADAAAAAPWPIRYETEPRRGIPPARNAAVALAPETTDFIVFVDDDETVDPPWLAELLAVQVSTGADVVTGPSLPRLPSGAPPWLAGSGAFDLLRYRTGEERPFAFTHNVLARREVYRAVQPNFDERLIPCGGSDTHFFRRVRRAGFTIVWADEAVAREWIPPDRVSVSWLLRRALRIGGTDAFIERDLEGLATATRRIAGRAVRHAGRGVLRAIAAPARGRAGLLAAGQDWALAAGLLGGIVGYRHREYMIRDR